MTRSDRWYLLTVQAEGMREAAHELRKAERTEAADAVLALAEAKEAKAREVATQMRSATAETAGIR